MVVSTIWFQFFHHSINICLCSCNDENITQTIDKKTEAGSRDLF